MVELYHNEPSARSHEVRLVFTELGNGVAVDLSGGAAEAVLSEVERIAESVAAGS